MQLTHSSLSYYERKKEYYDPDDKKPLGLIIEFIKNERCDSSRICILSS
jgi:hypothetical protein